MKPGVKKAKKYQRVDTFLDKTEAKLIKFGQAIISYNNKKVNK